MMDISHIDIPGEADLMFRIRVQDIDNDGNIELFNDKKDLAYAWGKCGNGTVQNLLRFYNVKIAKHTNFPFNFIL